VKIETFDAPCPLCGEPSGYGSRLVLEQALYRTAGAFLPASIIFEVCPRDGFLHMAQRPTDASLESYYANSIEPVFESNRPRAVERAAFLDRFAPALRPPGSVLDIGCNDGSFLAIMQERRFTCRGVEPSSRSVRWLAENHPSIEIVSRPIQDAFPALAGRRYDLVTLFHVLEHLPRIDEILSRLAEFRPRYLFIEVPNGRGGLYPRITKEFGHLSYFTRRTLRRFLERNGFRVLHIEDADEHGPLAILRVLAEPGAASGASDDDEESVALGKDLDEVARRHEAWRTELPKRIDAFLSTLSPSARIGLFGAGTDSYVALDHDALRRRVIAVMDSNPLTHGVPFRDGLPVVSVADALRDPQIQAILITPRESTPTIRRSLVGRVPASIVLGDLESGLDNLTAI
jgi:SAM-dependent methyltransferase